MSTIPAQQLVTNNPSVLPASGSGIDVIGLLLTTSTRVPIGTAPGFPDAASVGDYFGDSSSEKRQADKYFGGFNGSARKPASMLAAQYNQDDVAAYLRGGELGLTLAEVQALNAAIAVTIDGSLKSATVNLLAATSLSNAGQLLSTGLNIHGTQAAAITGAISGTTLTVSAVGSGALAVGQIITGAGVSAATYITALGSGTGGTGTYTVSVSQTVGSEGLTGWNAGVTYDSVSGAFVVSSATKGAGSTITFASGALATSLKLTSATGAVLSQGADAASPSTFMDGVLVVTTDWVTFWTGFDPDDVDENTVKLEFAAWGTAQNDRYAYICWDLDQSPVAAVPAAASMGQILEANGNSGTCLLNGDANAGWDDTTGPDLAAFVAGSAASIDFTEVGGRISFAYKAQDGIAGTVTDGTTSVNLGGNPQSDSGDRGNGYNFYGAYGSANRSFVWFQRGFVTGDFKWLDSFINQVWLNNTMQQALLDLEGASRSLPFGNVGAAAIQAALATPIKAGLDFGAYGPDTLDSTQQAEVNAQAGASISAALQTQGSFLQVPAVSSAVRSNRGPQPIKFWYIDRGSIQSLNLGSVAVQ